jgi:hypothetical protein
VTQDFLISGLIQINENQPKCYLIDSLWTAISGPAVRPVSEWLVAGSRAVGAGQGL